MRGVARLGLMVLAVATGACSRDGDPALRTAIADQIERGSGTVLRMTELAPFEWDRLHVFPPYSSPEQIDRETGVACPSSRRANIERRDDASLLLFVAGRRVTRHLAHPRSKGDFASLHRAGGYMRAEAVFVVEPTDGWPRLAWPPSGSTAQ